MDNIPKYIVLTHLAFALSLLTALLTFAPSMARAGAGPSWEEQKLALEKMGAATNDDERRHYSKLYYALRLVESICRKAEEDPYKCEQVGVAGAKRQVEECKTASGKDALEKCQKDLIQELKAECKEVPKTVQGECEEDAEARLQAVDADASKLENDDQKARYFKRKAQEIDTVSGSSARSGRATATGGVE